jgi:hypothetical protein
VAVKTATLNTTVANDVILIIFFIHSHEAWNVPPVFPASFNSKMA